MSNEERKSRKVERLRNAFSHFTLLLTLGFGVVTTLTLLEAPSRTLQPQFATTTSRGPASITTGTTVVEKPFMSTLNVKCEGNEALKTYSEHVRIKSPGCQEGQDYSVKNLSNGFSATVFSQANSGFTTDYVALVKGENKIRVESRTPAGETRTQEFTVIKE